MGTQSGTASGIPRHDFDLLLKHYDTYLRKIALKYAGDHPFGSADDIYQMLSMVLWECQQRYTQEPDPQFHNILASCLMNRIGRHFAAAKFQDDRDVARLDATPSGSNSKSEGRHDAYPISRTEESEDFYRAGIFELLETLPPETAQVVMDSMDPAKGYRQDAKTAYYIVKNALNGL